MFVCKEDHVAVATLNENPVNSRLPRPTSLQFKARLKKAVNCKVQNYPKSSVKNNLWNQSQDSLFWIFESKENVHEISLEKIARPSPSCQASFNHSIFQNLLIFFVHIKSGMKSILWKPTQTTHSKQRCGMLRIRPPNGWGLLNWYPHFVPQLAISANEIAPKLLTHLGALETKLALKIQSIKQKPHRPCFTYFSQTISGLKRLKPLESQVPIAKIVVR